MKKVGKSPEAKIPDLYEAQLADNAPYAIVDHL